VTGSERPDDGPLAGHGAEQLIEYLRTALARSELTYAQPPARLSGGNETFIYDLRLRGGPEDLNKPLILRAYREGYARPDQARFESAVQNALAGLGYPSARVFVTAPEPDVLGTPFIIMERLPGTLLLEGIGELDDSGKMRFEQSRNVLRGIGLLREIPRICAEAQARLHALDPQPLLDAIEREGLPRASVTVEGRLEAIEGYIDGAGLDGLREAFAWLVAKKPEPERLAVCHGDTQPNNILMTGKTITGVVDWSQVIVGDPALDVGYTKMALETVPLELPPFLRWLARPIARVVSHNYMRSYLKERSVRPEAVAYFGILRALFALAGIGARRVSGSSEPDVWDNPAGVRNLIARVRSVTGIDVRLPQDRRAGRA
jgi:aminoglycoside phosphotransferase (APT) family kinase protein